jgi:CrcB protein
MYRLDYVFVAAGGAIGSIGRYWLSQLIDRRTGGRFPWGTLLVNVTGCLAIGVLVAFAAKDSRFVLRPEWRLALITGLCGGYTTFSAFSLQTLTLTLEGQWAAAALNVILSVLLCLAAVWIGYTGGSFVTT